MRLRSLALRLLRDNEWSNRVGRALIRQAAGVLPDSKLSKRLRAGYRTYGVFEIAVQEARFRVFSRGDDYIANEFFYDSARDSLEVRLLQRHAAANGTFIDIGANTGIFSLLAAATPGIREVLSIEPAPSNVARFRRNLSLNPGLPVCLVEAALGESSGSVDFAVPLDGGISTVPSANVEFSNQFGSRGYRSVPVRLATLDEVIGDRALSPQDLLKIDVETYELPLLRGAARTLSMHPAVMIEIWSPSSLRKFFPHLTNSVTADHGQQVEAIFRRHGYRPYGLRETGLEPLESLEVAPDEINYVWLHASPARALSWSQLPQPGLTP